MQKPEERFLEFSSLDSRIVLVHQLARRTWFWLVAIWLHGRYCREFLLFTAREKRNDFQSCKQCGSSAPLSQRISSTLTCQRRRHLTLSTKPTRPVGLATSVQTETMATMRLSRRLLRMTGVLLLSGRSSVTRQESPRCQATASGATFQTHRMADTGGLLSWHRFSTTSSSMESLTRSACSTLSSSRSSRSPRVKPL